MRKYISSLFLFVIVCAFGSMQIGCASPQCGEAGLPSCSEGKTCGVDPLSGVKVCLQACSADKDCPSNPDIELSCQPTKAGSEPEMACKAECKDNAHCDDGLTCKDGKCVAGSSSGCESNSDCASDEVCNSGVCEDKAGVDCAKNSDCNDGMLCKSGKCTSECAATDNCGNGWSCVSGKCTKDGATPDCTKDGDCASGQVCKDGTCVADTTPECSASKACPSGKECQNGKCVDVTTAGCESFQTAYKHGSTTVCLGVDPNAPCVFAYFAYKGTHWVYWRIANLSTQTSGGEAMTINSVRLEGSTTGHTPISGTEGAFQVNNRYFHMVELGQSQDKFAGWQFYAACVFGPGVVNEQRPGRAPGDKWPTVTAVK